MLRSLALGCVALTIVPAILAQEQDADPDVVRSNAETARKTILEFELLADGPLSGGLAAHEWAETLQELGAGVIARQSRGDDKLGVTEKTRGTLRWVTVVAQLNERGKMVLPNREFARSDVDLLREWIDELKLYGAQGAPEGKPLWGLSESQFKAVFNALSELIADDGDGQPLMAAVEQLGRALPYPVRFHSTATEHLNGIAGAGPTRHRLSGMTSGTGLAGLLAEYGLGFRPLRTPAGGMELVVQPLHEIADPWPVGWDLQADMRRHQLAPALFKMVPVQFDDVPLQDVLDAIANATDIPMIVDYYGIDQHGIDLEETTLSYPPKRIAWIQVVHSATVRHRMTETLKIDEKGQPFLHITPFVPRRVSE